MNVTASHRLGLLVASAWLGVAVAAACSSDPVATSEPVPRGDSGSADALPEAGGPCQDTRDFPCSRLVFAEGAPSRLFHVIVPNSNIYGQGPFPAPILPAHAGSDEMPSFDKTGNRVVYIRVDGSTRSIRMVGVDGKNDQLVVGCSGVCESPYLASDDSIWFIDRLATGVAEPKHVVSGASIIAPWSQEISGCVLRSMRTTLERDGIVLSITAGSADADAGTDAGDASAGPAICPAGSPSIVVARLDASTLPPSRLLEHKSDQGKGPLAVVTQATASTATGRIFAIANSLNDDDPGFVTAYASGEIIWRSSDALDAFDMGRSTTEKQEYFIARRREQNSPGYFEYILWGESNALVGIAAVNTADGIAARTGSKTLGPPAWAAYAP